MKVYRSFGVNKESTSQGQSSCHLSWTHHSRSFIHFAPNYSMLASGFTGAPISRLLVFGVVGTAFLASLTDTKVFCWIEIRPHLLDYGQFWRLLTWQFAYTNSAEVLFAAMTFYHLRVIERLWGSRKFAVCISRPYSHTRCQDWLTGR